jgi:hypothetical protein
MSDRRHVDVGDLGRAETLVSIGLYGLRHGDAGILASARRFLRNSRAARPGIPRHARQHDRRGGVS